MAKKVEHTPGPWEVMTDKKGRLSIRRKETFESIVYYVDPGTGFSMDRHKADAKFIASAPDMENIIAELLKVLKRFVDNFEACASCLGTGIHDDGVSACPDCGGTAVQITSRGMLLSEIFPDALAALKKAKGGQS